MRHILSSTFSRLPLRAVMRDLGLGSKVRTYIIAAVILTVIPAGIALFSASQARSYHNSDHSESLPEPIPQFAYGFDLDSFELDYFKMEPNDFLGSILGARGVPYESIDEVARAAKNVYDVRMLRPGKQCAIVRRKGTGYVDCFVYEANAYEYVLYHVYDSAYVEIHRHEVEKCLEQSAGQIDGSLWLTMDRLGHPYELISRMEDALAWTVSFQHVQPGDTYKLIYERDYINGVPVGIGKLVGASFETGGRTTYSVYYESEKYQGFFDEEGRPMERAFLKAPVRYSRISSRYSTRRYHPILKRYKGHFGTDYAAPYNTPIVAVADGKVTKASYTKGNGNYVKIRHDQTYETQYLHMSRFAKGITPGVHVKQGDVIGYVGATGLATGPHVCFRFWKNGRQVDHLRENLPPPDPMAPSELPDYFKVRDEVIPQVSSIKLDEQQSSTAP